MFDINSPHKFVVSYLAMVIIFASAIIGKSHAEILKPYFENSIVKILVMFFIAYYSSKDIQVSLALALLFITISNLLMENEINDSIEQARQYSALEHFTQKAMLFQNN